MNPLGSVKSEVLTEAMLDPSAEMIPGGDSYTGGEFVVYVGEEEDALEAGEVPNEIMGVEADKTEEGNIVSVGSVRGRYRGYSGPTSPKVLVHERARLFIIFRGTVDPAMAMAMATRGANQLRRTMSARL